MVSRSLPGVHNRGAIGGGYFQFLGRHLHLALRCPAIDRPDQFVTLDFVGTLERLSKHSDLCHASLVKLGRDLDASLARFPFTEDQILRRRTAAGKQIQHQANDRAHWKNSLVHIDFLRETKTPRNSDPFQVHPGLLTGCIAALETERVPLRSRLFFPRIRPTELENSTAILNREQQVNPSCCER